MAECVNPIGPEEALEKLKDQVTCAVCLQSYSKPKVLQCFHIFCQDCLKKLVIREGERVSITCAICRKETALTASGKGVSDLPSAFHMNNLLEIEGGLKRIAGTVKLVTNLCSSTSQLEPRLHEGSHPDSTRIFAPRVNAPNPDCNPPTSI